MLGIFSKIDRKPQSTILGPDICIQTILPSGRAGKLTSSYGERKPKERNKVSKENTNAGNTRPHRPILSFHRRRHCGGCGCPCRSGSLVLISSLVIMRALAVHERGGGWVSKNASCRELEDPVFGRLGDAMCYGYSTDLSWRSYDPALARYPAIPFPDEPPSPYSYSGGMSYVLFPIGNGFSIPGI